MVESIVYRLLPLLCWDDFTLKVGFVLAFLLGLWLGWGWERKKCGDLLPDLCRCLCAGRSSGRQPDRLLVLDWYVGGVSHACGADWSGGWQGDFRAPGEKENNGGRV